MSTVIQDQMQELESVENELKLINTKAKELRERKKTLTKSITEWLIETDRPGVMFGGLVVLRKESTTHSKLKKKEKQERAITALEERGIADAQKIFEIMSTAMVGEELQETKLKIKLA